MALGYTGTANGRVACPATSTAGAMINPSSGARADGNCANVPVIVDNNCTGTTGLTLQGGIYVNGALLPTASGVPYVTDLQLANTDDGQTFIVYYSTSASTISKRVDHRGEAVDRRRRSSRGSA